MFECHVTLDPADAGIGEALAKVHKFKTSEIARDEVMGDKNWFYCTKSHKDFSKLRDAMNNLVVALKIAGVYVHRTKIEHIVWDWRPNKKPLDMTAGL